MMNIPVVTDIISGCETDFSNCKDRQPPKQKLLFCNNIVINYKLCIFEKKYI